MESETNESESDNKGLLIVLNSSYGFFGEITKENKKFIVENKPYDEIFGEDANLFASYIHVMVQFLELNYKINVSKIFWIKNNKLKFLANINLFVDKNNKDKIFTWVNCADKKINSDLAQKINDNIKNVEDSRFIYGKIKEVLDDNSEEELFLEDKNKKITLSNRFENNIFQKTDDDNSMSGIVSLLNTLFNNKKNKEEFIILDDLDNQYYFSIKMDEFWNLFNNCLKKINKNEDITTEINGMNLILKSFKKKPDKFKNAFFETIEGGLKGMTEKNENKNIQYCSMLADMMKNFPAGYKTLFAPELSEQIENYNYSQKDYGHYLKIVDNLEYFGVSKKFPYLADFERNFKKLIEISAAGESSIKIFNKKNIELLKSFGDKKYSPYLNSRKEEIDKIKKMLGFFESEHLENVKETVDSIKKK